MPEEPKISKQQDLRTEYRPDNQPYNSSNALEDSMRRRNLLKLAILTALVAKLLETARQYLMPITLGGGNQGALLPALSQTVAKITVDWTVTISQTTPANFGSNDFQIISPANVADSTYHNLLKQINLRLLRFHNANLSDAWSDATSKTWVASTIRAAYDAYLPAYGTLPTIVQTIPNWPKWMAQSNNMLDPAAYDEYANFCAALVRIINVDQNRGVMYWEPFNERDKIYKDAGRLDELWKIYNKAAIAMKSVDPTIKVGGPALTYNDTSTLAAFLRACANVDFVSWHRYQTGDPKTTTDQILAGSPNYANQVRSMRSIVTKYLPDRQIPLFLGEYNINYSWQSGETRQNIYIGAVWFASVLKHLADAGIEMATSWNAKDGIYGLIDNSNNLRLSATVFTWANADLVGANLKTTSDNTFVEAMAIRKADALRSLLLINKSAQPNSVVVQSVGRSLGSSSLPAQRIDQNGVSSSTIPHTAFSSGVILPAYSLTLLGLRA